MGDILIGILVVVVSLTLIHQQWTFYQQYRATKKRLHYYTVPKGGIAAGTSDSDGAGIKDMPEALTSRFVHTNLEPNLEDWQKFQEELNRIKRH